MRIRPDAKNHLIALGSDDKGVTLVEYALGLTLAIILGAGAFQLFASDISRAMNSSVVSVPD